MKKALIILAGIFGLLVLGGVVGIAMLATKGNALDKESKQYVDAAIPAITSQWDITEIQKRASPEFKAAVNDRVSWPNSRWLIVERLSECTNSIGSSMVMMCACRLAFT